MVTLTKTKVMADGLNEARALRVTEVLRDYQNIHSRIAQFQANSTQEEYNEIGYSSLRQCHTEARALLNAPYPPEMLYPPSAPNEAEKRQLQRVIIDASARRFLAQRIFLRASAAFEWVQRRQSILQGNLQALRQADTALRDKFAAITNERITNAFRTADQQAGYWLHDDPSLQTILGWIRSHY
ncbi:hypothetical protein IMSHALPRED_010996 [Imshaugia aleurites]|uniref:Uncharacterized protein n=1 Tax=Imshaugia aleurites TaxID=172621 RepID=A0A8H3GBX9_9LECA|nr:hypothetical protein IMSHALPRED_010996 [Imshaugia aleurites]